MKKYTISALIVTFAILGCKSRILSQHKEKAQAKIEQIRKMSNQKIPSLTADTLAYPSPLVSSFLNHGDVAIFPLEEIELLGKSHIPSSTIRSEDNIVEVARWVEQNEINSTIPTEVAEKKFQLLFKLDKVILVKTLQKTAPVVKGEQYIIGKYEGEAHLFELSGKYYGGVRFQAENSKEVSFTKQTDQNGTVMSDDLRLSLEEDLNTNAKKALIDAIKKQVPGSNIEH